MIEAWKPIPEYEELYEVNIKGQVRSLPHRVLSRWGKTRIQRGMLLKPQLESTGYLFVRLYKNGKSKKFSIHRLIALNFLEKTGECVNHKDSDRTNNSIDNLEWCSQQENIQHAQDKGRLYFKYGEQHPNNRLTSQQVLEILGKHIPYEYGRIKLAREYGVSDSAIKGILEGKNWKAEQLKFQELVSKKKETK